MRRIAYSSRNLPDEVLTAVTKRGGMVLLTFDREYLFGEEQEARSSGIAKLLEHIYYIVKRCGVDHVGLGSDYGGSGRNASSDLQGVECFRTIAPALTGRRYTVDEIKKIMGENLVRFFSASARRQQP